MSKINHYLLNRASYIKLKKRFNFIVFKIGKISLEKNEKINNYKFKIGINKGQSLIKNDRDENLYINRKKIKDKYLLNNFSVITISDIGDFIYFKIKTCKSLDFKNVDEEINNFIETGELKESNIKYLLKLLNSGSDKMGKDEFFSIIAQVDIPEIDK